MGEDVNERVTLDIYISDEQFQVYLDLISEPEHFVTHVDFNSLRFTEEQVSKVFEVLFNKPDPSLNNVQFILFTLRTRVNNKMDFKKFYKDILERIDLHPASEAEVEEIQNRGYTTAQRDYVEFLCNTYVQELIGQDYAKELLFNVVIPKLDALVAEGCLGKRYFLFVESEYPYFIDEEVFAKYKDQLTSYFILHHPELYKKLELRDDVKEILKRRLRNKVSEELENYGYPEGSIQFDIRLDLDQLNLYDAVIEDEVGKKHLEINEYSDYGEEEKLVDPDIEDIR